MDLLDGGAVVRWAQCAVSGLAASREGIDAINVFPVADGDTGTNVYLTLAEGAAHVDGLGDPTAAQAGTALARGSLLGARGNSGVIISQFLGGFARVLASQGADDDGIGPRTFAKALRAGHRAARRAVAQPIKGTVLSATSRAAKHAKSAARGDATLALTALAALAGAREATHRSPERLGVLARAGVVDAGAAAFVVVVEGLVEAITGSAAPTDPLGALTPRRAVQAPAAETDGCSTDAADGEFEVMLLVGGRSEQDLGDRLRARLARVGESVAVVGGAGMWQAHVHTDHPDRALETAALGAQRQVVVRHLDLHARAGDTGGLGVVAVIAEPGLLAHVARTGAVVHVPSHPPSTPGELARAVTDTGAETVVVLGSDAGTLEAARLLAEQVASGSGAEPGSRTRRIEVIEVRDGLHAALALAGADLAADVTHLRAVVDLVRTVDVPPDAAALERLAGLLDGGAELLAVLRGSQVSDGLVGQIEQAAREAGVVDVVVLEAGRAEPALVLGAE